MKNFKHSLLIFILVGMIAFIAGSPVSLGYSEDWNNYTDETVIRYPVTSGSNTIMDYCGKGNHATNYAYYSSGRIGEGLYFNGINSYAAINPLSLNVSKGLTISAWTKFDTINQWSRIIEFSTGAASNNIIFGNEGSTGNLVIALWDRTQGTKQLTAPNAINFAEWRHYVVTINSSGWACLYVNGVRLNGGQLFIPSNTYWTTNYLGPSGYTAVPRQIERRINYIGKSPWAGDYTNAEIDSLIIYERVLAESVIMAHAREGYLWADYNFDNSIVGNYLQDKTENNYNGTIYGAKCVPSGNHYALEFDGVDDYVRLLDFDLESNYTEDIIISNGFSIETWVYPTGFNHYSRILELSDYSETLGRCVSNVILGNVGTTTDLFFEVYDKEGNSQGKVILPNGFTANTWNHFVITVIPEYQQSLVYIYKNGVGVKTGYTGKIRTASPYQLDRNYIGRSTWSGDGYFKGKINMLKIHRRVLSHFDVYANYINTKDTN